MPGWASTPPPGKPGGLGDPQISLDTGYIHYPLPSQSCGYPRIWRGLNPTNLSPLFSRAWWDPRRQQSLQTGPEVTSKKPQKEEKQPVPARAPSLACSGPGSGGGRASGASRAPIPPAEPMATQLPTLCLLLGMWGEYQEPRPRRAAQTSRQNPRPSFPAPGGIGTLSEPKFGA